MTPPSRTLYLCGAGNSEGVRLALTIQREHSRWQRIVILDDDPAKQGQSLLGVTIGGPFASIANANQMLDEAVNFVARSTPKRWAARATLEGYGLPFTRLVHPGVDLLGATLGRDVIVYQNAHVGPLVSIGEGCVVFMGGVVGHGSSLGRCCVVGPNAVINARVRLGDGVYVGSNATILPEVKVGSWATIAAGTLVARDVPDGATVIGVPGRTALTLDVKLRLGEFKLLPQALRRELEDRARAATLARARTR